MNVEPHFRSLETRAHDLTRTRETDSDRRERGARQSTQYRFCTCQARSFIHFSLRLSLLLRPPGQLCPCMPAQLSHGLRLLDRLPVWPAAGLFSRDPPPHVHRPPHRQGTSLVSLWPSSRDVVLLVKLASPLWRRTRVECLLFRY